MKLLSFFTIFLFIGLTMFGQKEVRYNEKGIELAQDGKQERALKYFTRAIKANSGYAETYLNRGNVYRMREEFDLAIKDYTSYVNLKPDYLPGIYTRAKTYVFNKQFEEAIADYTTIIDKKPDFPKIWFDRAYAYIRLGDFEKAKNDLEEQLYLDPTHFGSLANLAQVKFMLGIYEDALYDYDELIEKFPRQPSLHVVYNNRSTLFVKLEEYENALEDANYALILKPDYDIGHLTRAMVYYNLDDFSHACADFRKALELGVRDNDHFEVDDDYLDLEAYCH